MQSPLTRRVAARRKAPLCHAIAQGLFWAFTALSGLAALGLLAMVYAPAMPAALVFALVAGATALAWLAMLSGGAFAIAAAYYGRQTRR